MKSENKQRSRYPSSTTDGYTSIDDDTTSNITNDTENEYETINKPSTKRLKRDRSSRACIVCRKRKVKCDAVQCFPKRCSNCAQFNIKNCIIPAPKKRKSKKIEELLKVNADVELSTGPDDIEKGIQIIQSENLKNYPSYVESNLQERYPEMMSVFLDPKKCLEQDLEIVKKYAESVDWYGPFSKTVLSAYLSENIKNHGGPVTIDNIDYNYLLQSGCFNLPPPEVCWEWIDNFFKLRYYQFPILNEKKFRNDYKDLKNPPSLLLLQSVLHAGARFYDNSNWSIEERKEQVEKSDILYKRAKILYDKKVEPDTLCNLQALLLLANYKSRNKFDIKTDCNYIRASLDLAYALGIHKNPASLNIHQEDKKLYKRIWWTLFILDTLYSFILFRPWAVDCMYSNYVPMIEAEDFSDDKNDSSIEESPEISYFIHRVKLSLCIRKICESRSKISFLRKNSDNYTDCLEESDQMMTDWIEQLPTSSMFRINSPSNNVFNACLSLEYYGALLLLHRIHILTNPNLKGDNAYKYPSWGIVFKAAHMVAVISRYIIENNHILFCQNLIPFVMNIAGIMMIYHLYNKDKTVHRIAKEDIETFLELLHKVSVDWPFADMTYYLLNSIYQDKSKQYIMLNNVFKKKGKINRDKVESQLHQSQLSSLHHINSLSATNVTTIQHLLPLSNLMTKSFTDVPINSILYNTSSANYNNVSMSQNYENNKSSLPTTTLPSPSTTSYVSSPQTTQKHPILFPNGNFNGLANNTDNIARRSNRVSLSPTPKSGININSYASNNKNFNNQNSEIPVDNLTSTVNPLYGKKEDNISKSNLMNVAASMDTFNLPPFPNYSAHNDSINTKQTDLSQSPVKNSTNGFSNPINLLNTKSYSNSFTNPNSDTLLPLLSFPLPAGVHQLQSLSLEQQHLQSHIQPHLPTSGGWKNQVKFNKTFNNQNVVSRKFDLVMPPDLVHGMDTVDWKLEFDTSMLTATKEEQLEPNLEFGQFFEELGL